MNQAELLRRLAAALDECTEVIDSKEMLSVMQMAQVHGFAYAGKALNTTALRELSVEARVRAATIDGDGATAE